MSFQLPDGHITCPNDLSQARVEIPFGAWTATKEVETHRRVLWKCMHGKVRLSEQAQAGDSTSSGEHMPPILTDYSEIEIGNDFVEE